MQEKLEKLRLNKFLEIRSWAGLSPMPGTTGIIIDEDIYLKLVNYLEEKVIGKDFENINTRDAGVSISGNINNNRFNINNHFDIYNDLKRIIYSKEKAE